VREKWDLPAFGSKEASEASPLCVMHNANDFMICRGGLNKVDISMVRGCVGVGVCVCVRVYVCVYVSGCGESLAESSNLWGVCV